MAIIRTEDEQKIANTMFDALRDELLKRELSNTESYDRAILTLSAASLGISLTAIKFVVPLETAEYIWLIKSGWLLLLGSIIISLIAYLMSNNVISVQMKNAEDYYTHGVAEAFNRSNRFTSINSALNKATGILFIIAISAIVFFVILNINSESMNMSKKGGESNKPTTTTVNVRDSANIPAMQQAPSSTGVEKNSANIPTMQQAPGTQTTSQTGEGGDSGSSSSSGTGGGSSS